MMSFNPGEMVGSYRIVEQLGSGGMATVFKAYHASLDRYVAVKVMHAAFRGDPNFMARFEREAKVVARLEHPNIVSVYDFSEHEGAPYLVMRFVEGETLKTRTEQRALTPSEILGIIQPVAQALDYAHKQGVLHRDVKPSNIILTPDEDVFLTDFGLARMAQTGESSLTRDGMVGTPFYISPEQAIGMADLDARADVYSLGVVIYELFTGQVPFTGDTPFAVIHDHIYTPLPMPSTVAPDLPEAVERVLLKALAKERDDRYESTGGLLAALDQAMLAFDRSADARAAPPPPVMIEKSVSPTPAVATPPLDEPTPAQSPSWPKWLFALGSVAIVGLVILAAVFLLTRNKKSLPDRKDGPLPPPTQHSPPPQGTPGAPPQDAQFHFEQAQQIAESGNIESALAALQAAIEQEPGFIPAYEQSATWLAARSEFGPAAEVLERGVQANPESAELRLSLVRMLVVDDRWGEALPHLEWLIEHDPDMAEAYAYLGVYMAVEQEDLDQAQQYVGKANSLNSDLAEVHFALGVYYWKTRDFRRARLELERAHRAENAPPWLRMRTRFYLDRLDEAEESNP